MNTSPIIDRVLPRPQQDGQLEELTQQLEKLQTMADLLPGSGDRSVWCCHGNFRIMFSEEPGILTDKYLGNFNAAFEFLTNAVIRSRRMIP